jgi:membrane protein DedA with SNARE-associated domain
MNDDFKMSPLAHVLVSVLGKATWVAAALLILFGGILLFQRLTPEGTLALQDGDLGFLGVLAGLLLLAIYIVRGIKREIEKPGG